MEKKTKNIFKYCDFISIKEENNKLDSLPLGPNFKKEFKQFLKSQRNSNLNIIEKDVVPLIHPEDELMKIATNQKKK